MKVTVNGESVDVAEHVTVVELLDELGFPARGIAVAIDWEVLPRSDWHVALTDGAKLEIVTAVQGG